jgi:hypothetical protein
MEMGMPYLQAIMVVTPLVDHAKLSHPPRTQPPQEPEMSESKFNSGDIVLHEKGNGTVHAYQAIELTDGTYAWRDLGIMQFENNTLSKIDRSGK